MTESNKASQEQVRKLIDLAVRRPTEAARLDFAEFNLLVRVLRRVRLLGRFAVDLQQAGLFEQLPQVAQDQLQSAIVLAESRTRLARWELDRIAWALAGAYEKKPIVMKGCTYILLGTPNARGRLFADVDLMFPRGDLQNVEEQLNDRGWRSQDLSPYDQNYYRNWTHELPPLMHETREVEIDLHHNLLPGTARLKPAAKELLRTAVQSPDSRYFRLSDEDIVLHAMTHLMFGDDLSDKLRDLVDIDELLRHFSVADSGYWQRLVQRAETLDLRRPAFYAFRYANKYLGCAIPDEVARRTRAWGPPMLVVRIMDRLVRAALYPPHPDHPSRQTAFFRWLLFVRSHWIRMPPWLLVYHLSYKFYLTRIRRIAKDKGVVPQN